MSVLGAIGHAVEAGAGDAYDYLTPGTGSSRVTNAGESYFVPSPAPAPTPTATKVAAPAATSYDPTSDIAALNKEIAAEQANYTALQNQIAAQPVLPVYNTAAAYSSAQTQATSLEDAVYQDKLNQYLQGEALGKTQATTAAQTADAAADTTLTNETADNATAGQRATEDQANSTADQTQSNANYQQDSGTAFDKARTALLGTVANSGLTTSGLGQGQIAGAVAGRNQADTEQTETFNNSIRDINTTANRTFQDLATSNTRNTATDASSKAADATTLQNYIDNANLAEQGERTSEAADEQSDIASTTQNLYQQGVTNFINSLVGSGARSQDIALAQQVYGGSG